MAIIITPKITPADLLVQIRNSMNAIETWSMDSDGDFTHSPAQWNCKAWFRPKIDGVQLVFIILTPRGVKMSRSIYGVYHGRFIEMLLIHFDLIFTEVTATALPARGDMVSGS